MIAGLAVEQNVVRDSTKVLLVGESEQIAALRGQIERVAQKDAKVLITGETGVGKEIVAQCIHASSLRSRGRFVDVNCGGLTETLLESELFGHVRGSFTGAYRDKAGKLELAHEGTIFLDEVGEMTLRMQGLLLRLLETGELQKVGSDSGGRKVNVRVIAATNRSLGDLVSQAAFREDLFYRLNVIHIEVPPLRERPEDISVLVEHFLRVFTRDGACEIRTIGAEAMSVLTRYKWPGNVRELVNLIERLTVTCTEPVATVDDLPPAMCEQNATELRPSRERRRTPADQLFHRLTKDGESFWLSVYPLYMERKITRETLREVIRQGLLEARGNYRIVARIFNLQAGDYKRFLSFLRKHDCNLPFQEFRR
jgi:transcriptional regulator with PAS, ATPase and Fis domain